MWYYGEYQLGIPVVENNKASRTCSTISIRGDEEPSFSIKLALPEHWQDRSKRENPLLSMIPRSIRKFLPLDPTVYI